MDLHLPLVFGVFLVVLNIALSQTDNNKIGDVDGGGFLLCTSRGLYYKKEDAMYTLYVNANTSSSLYDHFDYHYAKGLAFFQTEFEIASMPLMSNRPPVTTVIRANASEAEAVTDFAVDWVHDRIIYSTHKYELGRRSTALTLASVDLQGGDNKIIVRAFYNQISIDNLAIDPFAGKIFWKNEVSISSCNLDGSDRKTVLINEATNEDLVTALTLDLSIRRIFFVTSLNAGAGNYSLNSVDYGGGQIITGLYNFDKVTGNTRREITSVDSLQERLLLFSTLYDQTKGGNGTFVMQSLHNGIVEEEQVMVTGEKELEAVPILDARFVQRGLQPSSDPTVKKSESL